MSWIEIGIGKGYLMFPNKDKLTYSACLILPFLRIFFRILQWFSQVSHHTISKYFIRFEIRSAPSINYSVVRVDLGIGDFVGK